MMKNMTLTQTAKLLTPTGGYLEGYTHTVNPYVGCVFACQYCYVRRMPVALFQKEPWGEWLKVKENAPQQLKKEFVRHAQRTSEAKPLRLFMSSSTDPYQPIEYNIKLTRALLEVFVQHADRLEHLFIQTRSPLVGRDLDLLKQLGSKVIVSVTVETDLEMVRRVFSPAAPPIQARIKVLQQLHDAGIKVQAAVSPILPHSQQFASKLVGKVQRVCLDDYFVGDGQGGKRTAQLGIKELCIQHGWQEWYEPHKIKEVEQSFLKYFTRNQVLLHHAGFQ